MNKTQMNLQDLFLNQVRKENIGVTIYLTGGVQLKGYVRGFDAFTVLLESPGKPTQLVYKHAVASVVPSRWIRPAHKEEQEQEQGQEQEIAEKVEPAETPETIEEPAEEPALVGE